MAYLIPIGLPEAQVLTVYYLLGSMFGVFVLRKAQRLTSFFWSGAAIAASGAIVASCLSHHPTHRRLDRDHHPGTGSDYQWDCFGKHRLDLPLLSVASYR